MITPMKTFNYQRVAEKTIIHPDLDDAYSGIYALIDWKRQPYYIGKYMGGWNKTQTQSYRVRDRILVYDQIRNDNRGYVLRGHVYEFVMTLNKILTNDIRYNVDTFSTHEKGRIKYFHDYWHDYGNNLRTDGHINWLKVLTMFNEMKNRGYLEAVLLSRDPCYDNEKKLVERYNPISNQEHAVDEMQKNKEQEEARQELYQIMSRYGKIYPPIKME